MNASDSNVGSSDQESSIIEEGSNNTKHIHESNTVNNYDYDVIFTS